MCYYRNLLSSITWKVICFLCIQYFFSSPFNQYKAQVGRQPTSDQFYVCLQSRAAYRLEKFGSMYPVQGCCQLIIKLLIVMQSVYVQHLLIGEVLPSQKSNRLITRLRPSLSVDTSLRNLRPSIDVSSPMCFDTSMAEKPQLLLVTSNNPTVCLISRQTLKPPSLVGLLFLIIAFTDLFIQLLPGYRFRAYARPGWFDRGGLRLIQHPLKILEQQKIFLEKNLKYGVFL